MSESLASPHSPSTSAIPDLIRPLTVTLTASFKNALFFSSVELKQVNVNEVFYSDRCSTAAQHQHGDEHQTITENWMKIVLMCQLRTSGVSQSSEGRTSSSVSLEDSISLHSEPFGCYKLSLCYLFSICSICSANKSVCRQKY